MLEMVKLLYLGLDLTTFETATEIGLDYINGALGYATENYPISALQPLSLEMETVVTGMVDLVKYLYLNLCSTDEALKQYAADVLEMILAQTPKNDAIYGVLDEWM